MAGNYLGRGAMAQRSIAPLLFLSVQGSMASLRFICKTDMMVCSMALCDKR